MMHINKNVVLQTCKGNISFKLQKAAVLFEGQTYPISCFAFIQKNFIIHSGRENKYNINTAYKIN